MSSKILRDSSAKLVYFDFKDYDGKVRTRSVTLGDFYLNAQGNSNSDGNDLFGKADEINAAAKKIYSQMNPKYYKPYVSKKNRIILCLYNLVSSSRLAQKMSEVVSTYLSDHQKEINIAFLKEETNKPELIILPLKPAYSPPPPKEESPTAKPKRREDDWANPSSLKNSMLESAIKSTIRKEFPERYPISKKIGKKEIEEFKKQRSSTVYLLKRDIEEQFSKKPSNPQPDSAQKPKNRKVAPSLRIKIRDNPSAFDASSLFNKLEEKLKTDYPQKYPKNRKISQETLIKYLDDHPDVETYLINKVTIETSEMN